MNTPANPLEQLRDIHLPEPISWWPPAPGWWLLAVVLLALFSTSFVLIKKYLRTRRYRKVALAGLQSAYNTINNNEDSRHFLEQTSALLRRVAIQAYGRQEAAPLTGLKWLQFLDRTGSTDQFSNGPGAVLADGHYRPAIQADPQQVFALAQKWIKGHKKC